MKINKIFMFGLDVLYFWLELIPGTSKDLFFLLNSLQDGSEVTQWVQWDSTPEVRRNSLKLSVAGLIPQSLQAQLTLASLGWRHKSGEWAKLRARRLVSFHNQSHGGASILWLRSSCSYITEIGGPLV